jgi:hypothetical protein
VSHFHRGEFYAVKNGLGYAAGVSKTIFVITLPAG